MIEMLAANCNADDAEFIVLARNAFDIMMRRGWWAQKRGEGWAVYNNWIPLPSDPLTWPDPFTALVSADKWYRKHVEKGATQ